MVSERRISVSCVLVFGVEVNNGDPIGEEGLEGGVCLVQGGGFFVGSMVFFRKLDALAEVLCLPEGGYCCINLWTKEVGWFLGWLGEVR